MCGIFGHAGSSPKKVNIDKINTLGILNETRGVDSCGFSMDGNLLKGIKDLSKYRDFAAYYRIENPIVVPSVIGHTRKSTVGAHTLYNAHPFGFGKLQLKGIKGQGYEFVGVHNGTLLNHKELAMSRDIPLKKTVKFKVEDKDKKVTIEEKEVDKIDSELLLECLYKDNDFSVLSEYNGAAALMWTNLNNPNVMYYYHGKSKYNADDTETVEERSLYYWKESQNSLYVSSLMDSLYVIGGDGDQVEMFDHNTVYEVTNGNIKTAKKHLISREGRYQKENYYSRTNSVNKYNTSNDLPNNTRRPVNYSRPTSNVNISGIHGKNYIPPVGSAEQLMLNLQVPVDTSLAQEEFDIKQEDLKGITQMKQLRYFRNGHKAKGVFAYIKGFGFYFLGHTKSNAIGSLEQWAGKPFENNNFLTGNISRKQQTGFIPFNKKLVSSNPESFLHYMHDGIRYRNELDWRNVVNDSLNTSRFGIIELSMCSAHPIINIDEGNSQSIGAYYKGELYCGTINPLGSNKNYKFRFGQLTSISYVPGKVPEKLVNSSKHIYNLDSATKFLEQSASINKEVPTLDVAVEDLEKEHAFNELNDILLNHFHDNFDEFPDVVKRLNKIKMYDAQAQVAYNVAVAFLKGCVQIVQMGEKQEKDK